MSLENMLSQGAQRMGDLLLDIIEGIGSRIGGALGVAVSGLSNRESSASVSSGETPMIDGVRTVAPDGPSASPVKSQSLGRTQTIAMGMPEEEDPLVTTITLSPSAYKAVQTIKENPITLAHASPSEGQLMQLSPTHVQALPLQNQGRTV